MPYVDAMKIEGRSKSEFYVASVVKAYTHMRDSILANKEPDSNIVDLVNKIPHRAYWDGFLFNGLKDFPETEEVIASETKQSNSGSPRSARDDNEVVVSTTLDSAGPLFNRNYF
jgi:collagenase-like PrtC family protease